MHRLIVVCVLGLGACAAPRVVWEQPGKGTAAAEAQRQIDSAECMAIATQTVSLPPEAVETRVTVNFRVSDQSGVGDSGQMTATGSEMEAKRIRTEALKEAITERQALNDACMLHRGWMERTG
jgi:hypothetical protein